MTTIPGNTVPIKKPWLVSLDTVEVPLRVTHVANQYMMIENNPTNIPFCARSGLPIMYAMDAAAKPRTVGYQTTFCIHCRKIAANPIRWLKASFTHV